MVLNVLISTIDDRIKQIKNVVLKNRGDVQYFVSYQYTSDKFNLIPDELRHNDIFISRIPGKGVTKSRNNSIRHATGDIGLFSDDDVIYTNEYFDNILKIFSENPLLDVGIFKIKTPDGYPEYKNYPLGSKKLTELPFSISTIEIAFRIKKLREYQILFDDRFGAGNSFLIGSDESIFIWECIKAGLNVWYYPVYIVQHPFESTVKSLSKYDKKRVSVIGAFDSRINGWISIPKAFIRAIISFPDLIKHKKNPFIYLIERLYASFYILFTKPDKFNGK